MKIVKCPSTLFVSDLARSQRFYEDLGVELNLVAASPWIVYVHQQDMRISGRKPWIVLEDKIDKPYDLIDPDSYLIHVKKADETDN